MVDDDAAALVAAALEHIAHRDRNGYSGDFSRATEVHAILTAPDAVRHRCIVLAARDEPLESHTQLLSPIARGPAGMSLQEIQSVLPALQIHLDGRELAHRRGQVSCLVTQIEATWAALDDHGRARLLPRLDRAARIADLHVATRLCQLTVACADGDGEVPTFVVPPLIFSEAMRDVDLFIGVTSIGADPERLDRAKAGGSGVTGTAMVSGTWAPARRSAMKSSQGCCPCWLSPTAAS